MSKIEETLEKATKLRKSYTFEKKQKLDFSKSVDLGKIDNHCIVSITQPNSLVTEEYRRLKSILIRETKDKFLNTIMITSALAGEGKSITSINLAVMLAQEIDHSIILVDADLRRPMLHNYLGVETKYGLADYLTQDIDISDTLVKTGIGNLVLLPAGRAVRNPSEYLSSDKMKMLIRELKQKYMDRYVIIDTPPAMLYPEVITLCPDVDGIIFVIQEGHAKKKTIEEAIDIIKGFNVLGVVFNNVDSANMDGFHSHHYYKEYKRKGENE